MVPPWDKGKAAEQVPLDMTPLGKDRRVSFGRGCKLEDGELALPGPGGFSKCLSLPAPLSQLVGGIVIPAFGKHSRLINGHRGKASVVILGSARSCFFAS